MMARQKLIRRIRILLALFIVGLVMSGATAIPLRWELSLLTRWCGISTEAHPHSGLALWLLTVQDALRITDSRYPFLAYGTDWLAFGHFAIAIAFIGAIQDPVRNEWVVTFGLIACLSVIPYALIFGTLRGIPFYWRLIDCSFGVTGMIPLWYCRRWIRELIGLMLRDRRRSSNEL